MPARMVEPKVEATGIEPTSSSLPAQNARKMDVARRNPLEQEPETAVGNDACSC